MAQLVAHLHGMQGVRGSNPLSSTQENHPGEYLDLGDDRVSLGQKFGPFALNQSADGHPSSTGQNVEGAA